MFQTQPFSESSRSAPESISDLDSLSDAQLDTLSFGVVALNEEGVVQRYNLYESRLARLDRRQVLGRHFFNEIARCTRRPIFEGQFIEMVRSHGQRVAPFSFLFDFAFGAQDVSVEMVRSGSHELIYIIINRRKIHAPRPEFPKEDLAALQRELAPDETRFGVRRDELERRYVQTPLPFFSALRATCERLAPEAWDIFAQEWGTQWGRRIAIDIEATSLEQFGLALKDRPMSDVAKIIENVYFDAGLGRVQLDFSLIREGLITAKCDRSAIAEAFLSTRTDSGRPQYRSCSLLATSIAAILSGLGERRLVGREISCVAGGDETCTFVTCASERKSSLEQALREGSHGLNAIREQLRKPPRSAP